MKRLAFLARTNDSGLAFGLLVLRGFFGLTLALAHGWKKLPLSERFVAGVADLGFPVPVLFAWSAALSELVGGLLLALGLLTRPAALMVAATMGVAAFVRHAADPYATKEHALVFLVVAIVVFITGPGRYSIDARLFGDRARS